MHSVLIIKRITLPFNFIIFFLLPLNAQAGKAEMLNDYQRIEPSLKKNIYGIPIYITSSSTKLTQKGDVYGIINHPYKKVKKTLKKGIIQK